MKLIAGVIFVVITTQNLIIRAQAGECDKFQMSKAKECCNMPRFKDVDKIKKIFEELRTKDSNLNGPIIECKFFEQMLNETKLLKDKDVDSEGLFKYLDTTIDDEKWRNVFKSSFETCLKEVNEKIKEIQMKFEDSPHKIKKEQCNVKFMALNTCTMLEAFKNCPEEIASKEKECDNLKNWIKKCKSSVYSFTEVFDRIKNTS